MRDKIEPMFGSWTDLVLPDFESGLMMSIMKSVQEERKTFAIYPPSPLVFRALELVSPRDTRVVIVGQDPYVGKGEANGLAFAVDPEKVGRIPPSLVNILKEVEEDIGFKIDRSPDLLDWAKQGVLLLNTSLTVRANQPASHSELGWHVFTSNLLQRLATYKHQTCRRLVFMLWGLHAKNFAAYTTLPTENTSGMSYHIRLSAGHPSPRSSGFRGCKHFSKANKALEEQGISLIDW